ncbi:MAG: hypothetical protein PHP31_03375 [Lentimicrobiaceae bacterium]|nr:hypothetical protein [Lentimicrobiaceae bacterium]
MKKFSLIKIAVIAIIATLSLGLFTACNKENDALSSSKDNEVTIVTPENDIFTKWECFSAKGIKITLDLYKDRYYTTLSDTTPSLCKGLFFANNVWVEYQMNQDTMFLTKIGDLELVPDGSVSPKWLIDTPSDNVMAMEYLGLIPAVEYIELMYEFKRIK